VATCSSGAGPASAARCLDHQTQEVRDPACPNCYGTGFECGYFYPVACVWAEMAPRARRTELDAGQSRGTVDDVVVASEMVMTELLGEDDVWVNAATDDRWFVHRVSHTSEMRGRAPGGTGRAAPHPVLQRHLHDPDPRPARRGRGGGIAVPHLPRRLSTTSGVRPELLSRPAAAHPPIPLSQPQQQQSQSSQAAKPARQRLGLERINPHTYEPDLTRTLTVLFGKEPETDDATGELVFPG
jgi:hypothetical protein